MGGASNDARTSAPPPELATLRTALSHAFGPDRPRLAKSLARLRRDAKRGDDVRPKLPGLIEAIAASARLAADRADRVPKPSYDVDLPVVDRKDEIAEAIRSHQVLVLCGETGSGKSTQIPKICLELGRGAKGLVGHTQPRRLAARSIAARLAEELGVTPGKEVGSKIRFADDTSSETFIKVMTDGVLLAETRSDRRLEQYDTLVIDEAHERSLNIDFLLGYLRRLLPERPDLKLIITSATIDPERFAEHFAIGGVPAPIIEVSGRTYPVEVHYRPPLGEPAGSANGFASDPSGDAADGIASALDELRHTGLPGGRGDVLVFLPGEREIHRAHKALRDYEDRVDVLPLYARLSNKDQQRVFKRSGGGRQRVILATNVAETSLTVPGVTAVIDTGTARIARYAPRRKIQLLPVEPIARASADQRAGRCGRVAPGTCIRLFAEDDFNARPEFTDPEIQRSNLAGVILQMKSLRLGEPEDFPFIDAPDPRTIRDGHDTLQELGAEDDRGALTELGRKLARLPVDPRIGRMVLAADTENCLSEVLVIASFLEIQDPRERPRERQAQADANHARFRDERSDFVSILRLWDFYHGLKSRLSSNRLKKACVENDIHFVRMREWTETHRQLKAMVGELGLKPRGLAEAKPVERAEPGEKPPPAPPHERHDQIHRALLCGLLSSVGKKTEHNDYAAPRGGRFHVHPSSVLSRKKPEWVMAAELVRTTKLFARTVAAIDPAWIEDVGAHLVKRSHAEPFYNEEKQRVDAFERVSLLGLPVVERRPVHYGPIEPVVSREIFIHEALVEGRLRSDAPFMEHNHETIEQIETLEAKARRRDLLADHQARYGFYDARLPPEVCSSNTLHRFRKSAEREDPRVLFMRREDLLRTDPGVDDASFPDRMRVAPQTDLPLVYRHDPGAADDGVTLQVPLPALAQVTERHTENLVPGLLLEKLEALVRGLPKSLRRRFDPPATARKLADAVLAPRRTASGFPAITTLLPQIAELLSAECGQPVPVADLRDAELPLHLKMNVRVLDDQGQTVAESRDLDGLKRELGSLARSAVRGRAADTMERTGLQRWDLDELASEVELPSADVPIRAYPAMVDEPSGGRPAVAVRLFDNPRAALRAHQTGLRRLFFLESKREIRHAVRNAPGIDTLSLAFATLGGRAVLEDQLGLRAAEGAFLADGLDVRDAGTFDARLNTGFGAIADQAQRAVDLAAKVLASYTPATRQLARDHPREWRPAVVDIRHQLGLLVPTGFLTAHPPERVNHLPRYVAAARSRLDRLARGGLARDTDAMQQIVPRWLRYLELAERLPDRAAFDAELVRYRWLVEEFRVQLFDQRLGTAEPVSPQRLDEVWNRL
ncbi:MAG: ATP-dependent RNA helicase HrpA [Planctomycetota bacterium]